MQLDDPPRDGQAEAGASRQSVAGRFDLEAFCLETRGDRDRDRSLVFDDDNPSLHKPELRSVVSRSGGNRVQFWCSSPNVDPRVKVSISRLAEIQLGLSYLAWGESQ